MENMLRVGVISSTHGVRGEVKVFPTTDDVNRFKKLKSVYLDTGKEELELEIETVKFFKQMVILKFKGIDDINDIEKYKGKEILVTRENAVELKENEFFICDLIGLKVIDEEDKYLGELTEVLTTGANDVYVVTTEKQQEILFPVIDECVLDINIDKSYVRVRILPGLID